MMDEYMVGQAHNVGAQNAVPAEADTMKSLLAQTAGAVDEISNSLQDICLSLGDCTPNSVETVSEDVNTDTQKPTSMDQMRDLRTKAQDTQLVAKRIQRRLGDD